MTHAKARAGRARLALWGLLAATLLAGAAACGMANDGSALYSGTGGGDNADGAAVPGTKGGPQSTPSAGASAFPGAPTAEGVVLVHAAAFPSFRLCFENQPTLLPQPDSKVMPEANVVGVELGSVVRVDPIATVGTIYVINESEVRSSANEQNAPTCGELLGNPRTTRTLTKDNQYHVIDAPITTPLGQGRVQVLAITGCGSQAFLNALDNITSGADAPSANCGVGWSSTHGNLKAQVVDLATTPTGATPTALPVQLFHMSSAIEAFRGAGTLTVNFGPLAGGAKLQPVSTGALYGGGPPISLAVDQSHQDIYGADGFRVTIQGGQAPFSVDQTLADIQELSSPTDLPTDYYRAASNYALMLLGDPSHQPSLLDGGPNPDYNPRRAVHLLAVPVLDPTKLDAGTDASGPLPASPDGG